MRSKLRIWVHCGTADGSFRKKVDKWQGTCVVAFDEAILPVKVDVSDFVVCFSCLVVLFCVWFVSCQNLTSTTERSLQRQTISGRGM